jgi:hypothetical protein
MNPELDSAKLITYSYILSQKTTTSEMGFLGPKMNFYLNVSGNSHFQNFERSPTLKWRGSYFVQRAGT